MITDQDFKFALENYRVWKDFDTRMRKVASRGVNFHEGISEPIVCYVNGFTHSVGQGSEDAWTSDNKQVQIKGSSNFDSDLTSFGPTSEFDYLHFARLNKDEDILYLYDIPLEDLYNTKVNATQTMKMQQDQGRRPRFSIIQKYIKEKNLTPYAKVDLTTGSIIR